MIVGNSGSYGRNSYGYSDPTAASLISKENQEESDRFHKLLNTIFYICEIAGFEIDGRITLIDRKTGRIWK